MTRINLLPWREELRKQQNVTFGVRCAMGITLAVVILFAIWIHYNTKIDIQEQRNKQLTQELKKLDEKITKIQDLEKERSGLLARMNIIQDLQSRRPLTVRLFDELVRVVPEGLHLINFEQHGNTLKISGEAQSNARISDFMRSLDASEWFANPRLEIIETLNKSLQRSSRFTLHVTQATPQPKGNKPAQQEGKPI